MTSTFYQMINTRDQDQICLTADAKEVSCQVSTKTELREAGVDAMLSASLRDSVAFSIGAVPEVQAVFAKLLDRNIMHVWAVVPQYDRHIYRQIYAQEKEIIKQYGAIEFDFNVLPSRGRDPRTLITDPDIELAFLRK
jgi:hypothetical protein